MMLDCTTEVEKIQQILSNDKSSLQGDLKIPQKKKTH